MTDEKRTAESRARAEQALVWLLAGLDGADIELIVLGGLVPEVLTRGRELELPAHLGTTDVDILLVTHIDHAKDLGAVEKVLKGLKFSPVNEGWRWGGMVEGRKVNIEFLCDLSNCREGEVVLPLGCKALKACNLRGTGYVARDWAWEELEAISPEGELLAVRARFAGLQGYLLSKCVAARIRGAEKDYYDFVYVLVHNREGGPRQAARLLREGKLSDAIPVLEATLREIGARYHRHGDFAVQCYASQMRLVDPSLDEPTLKTDAVVAVAEFLEELGVGARLQSL